MFPTRRAFLFLQGPGSPFFTQLGQRLTDDGHKVVKVNFTTADRAAWHGKSTETFRDPWPMLGDFIADLWRRHGITDQVAFDDCRPAHKEAIRAARRRGIRNHVLTAGYFQPHWITLEREGVDGHSLLPRDPEWYHGVGPTLPHALPPRPFPRTLATRAAGATRNMGYHLAALADPLLFRQTRRHTRSASATCRSHARWLIEPRRDRLTDTCLRLMEMERPFYLFPLQSDDDPRLRYHSPYIDMQACVERVIGSFARFAPGHTHLAIGASARGTSPALIRRIRELATKTDIADRLVFVSAGDLSALIDHASGLVTINGHEGLRALESECPTLALGQAIYRLPGLISPSSLDDFWRHPIGPDRRLFRSFSRTVVHATQVNGSFYCREGIDLAVVRVATHLTDNVSPIERLLMDSRLPVAS